MDKKIQQTFQILEECAKNRQQIHYQKLYKEIGLNRENPDDRNKGSKILAEVNKISINKNKTMLSSLVTLKEKEQPADGFFELAVELNKLKSNAKEDDKLKFWVEEVKKVFKVYNKYETK